VTAHAVRNPLLSLLHTHLEAFMKANEAQWDRIVRVVLGLVLLYIGWAVISPQFGLWSIVSLLIGLILLVTGAVGTCPIYSLLKINTKGS